MGREFLGLARDFRRRHVGSRYVPSNGLDRTSSIVMPQGQKKYQKPGHKKEQPALATKPPYTHEKLESMACEIMRVAPCAAVSTNERGRDHEDREHNTPSDHQKSSP